jgi:GalNAc-alpha-(1->4)-GalNAc-alpha-(1->3)-diNAcBac-PP-undecaprenol alpha-1,4-N-acetyl-D-galactosaminyltransferase
VLTLAASGGSVIPVTACEHTDPRQHDLDPVWRVLRSLLYSRAAILVTLTEGVRSWGERLVKRDRVHIIPNLVPVSAVKAGDTHDRRGSGRTIAAMGQLALQKDFDLLLAAFGRCASRHADWSLVIRGEGEERRRLETSAGELGIESRVSLGSRSTPCHHPTASGPVYVGVSYEGFPVALPQAMACGLAVIRYRPAEWIEGDRPGRSERCIGSPPHVDALAAAMDRLMGDGDERERLGPRAVVIIERFSMEESWICGARCSSRRPKREHEPPKRG